MRSTPMQHLATLRSISFPSAMLNRTGFAASPSTAALCGPPRAARKAYLPVGRHAADSPVLRLRPDRTSEEFRRGQASRPRDGHAEAWLGLRRLPQGACRDGSDLLVAPRSQQLGSAPLQRR